MQKRNDRKSLLERRSGILIGLVLALTLGVTACSDDTSGAINGWDIVTEGFGDDAGPDTHEPDPDPDGGDTTTRCIEISPADEVDFGQNTIGQVGHKTIVIKNCSPNETLSLQDIEITDDGGGVFEIESGSLPDGLPGSAVVLEARERASFMVNFSPTAANVYNGSVRIKSNDASQRVVNLPLIGNGTANACPTASALATIQGDSSSRPGTVIYAEPLDTIQFDARGSVAPEGAVARYEWTILSSPSASSERVLPAGSETPILFLDASGEYKVELTVYDDEGTVSCGEPAIITIIAESGDDIHIQLTWVTESGVADNDVDLHYLHPNAQRWAAESYGWDCYYGNKTPDWNVPNGSPILDVDDLYGPGPENISHSNLEAVNYRIGVHYYSDYANGPAYATVEVRNSGILIFSASDKRLTDKQFWEVGSLNGRDRTVTPIGTITADFPQ